MSGVTETAPKTFSVSSSNAASSKSMLCQGQNGLQCHKYLQEVCEQEALLYHTLKGTHPS
jgi:hypothetical protein